MKVLLLDVDGLVIRPKNKYFSETYSEDYGIPIDEISPFFREEYKKAATGEADVKKLLIPYLKKWGWEGTVDSFLQYWLESERKLDQKVIKLVGNLRKKGIKVYLASVNETSRTRYLMEELGLKDKFDGGFFSSDLGVTKSDPEFFKKVLKKLDVKPSDIEYWDDDQKNVDVAKSVGIESEVYNSFKDLEKYLD